VLDFGLAKLAPVLPVEPNRNQIGSYTPSTFKSSRPGAENLTQAPADEASTLLLPKLTGEEAVTLALPQKTKGVRSGETRENMPLLTAPTDGLTRIGSLMGTPLYMSPEQCRGEIPGPQSDIYSLSVIAYQMLSGRTPFNGDMDALIRSHLDEAPPPLREVSPKTPKKIAFLIMSALAKDPAERPQSAAAFACALRARAEGTGTLLRRTFALFSEHFPTFLRISVISFLPSIVLTLLKFGNDLLILTGVIAGDSTGRTISIILNFLFLTSGIAYGVIISGVIVPIIIQLIVAPLRPLQSRAAFAVLRRRLRPFITTSLLYLLLFFGGTALCFLPGFVVAVFFALYAPVVLVENKKNWAALRRSQTLVRRAPGTAILIFLVQFAIPLAVTAIFGSEGFTEVSADFGTRLLSRLSELSTVLTMPLVVITSVLFYLKTRQAGGETLKEMLAQFEEEEAPLRKWQTRMRERMSMIDRPGSPT